MQARIYAGKRARAYMLRIPGADLSPGGVSGTSRDGRNRGSVRRSDLAHYYERLALLPKWQAGSYSEGNIRNSMLFEAQLTSAFWRRGQTSNSYFATIRCCWQVALLQNQWSNHSEQCANHFFLI